MASSITLKSSSYDGRYMELVCTQTSNGSAKNSSTIKWTLSTKGGDVNYYSTGPTKVVINGVTVYSKDRVKYSAETFPASKSSVSGEVTVGHSADGTKKITVSFSTAIYTSTVSTYSDSWTLDSIPRYGTSKQSLNSKTETTIKMNWSSDSTVDYLWYSTDNGAKWTGVNVTDGTSGTYTISSGISPNTTYNIKTRIRRKDSQLTTDSSALSVTTYNYPYCTSAPDFVIGNEVTLSFYNPLKRTFKFIVTGNGVEVGNATVKGETSYKGINAESTKTNLYNSIPSLKKAKYSITVIYGTSEKKKDGGYYSINESLCVPTFSNFTYTDTNTTVKNLIGNAGLIKGLSSLSVTISSANKMVAKNGATPKKYIATIDTLSKEITYSTSDVTKAIGTVTSSGTKRLNVTAYDSRGIPKTAYKDIVVYDYATPVITAKMERLNNFESQTTIKVSGTYSRLTINNADKNTITKIEYRRRVTGGTWPSTYTELTFTASAGKFSCPDLILDLDNSASFEFEFRVTDNLKTVSKSGTVGVGQAIFFISTNKKLCYMNGEEIAVLPVGSVYVSSANINPASTLGFGTWTLIDKGFASAYTSAESPNNAYFTAANNCTDVGTIFTRGDHSLHIRQSISTNFNMTDASADGTGTYNILGNFNWSKFGVTNIPISLIERLAYSDSANGGIVYTVHWDTGEVSQVDTFDLATVPSGKTFRLDFTVVVHKDNMLDAYCDKFYWKRTG